MRIEPVEKLVSMPHGVSSLPKPSVAENALVVDVVVS